jgi:hypothetical protein
MTRPITSRFIDLTPTWKEAAAIIAAALEGGTGTGREMARAELFRMAAILDGLKAEQTAAEAATFIIAKTDDARQRRTFLETRTVPHWTQDSQQADRLTQTDAERIADEWDDYARNKGLHATFTAIEAPKQEPQPRSANRSAPATDAN